MVRELFVSIIRQVGNKSHGEQSPGFPAERLAPDQFVISDEAMNIAFCDDRDVSVGRRFGDMSDQIRLQPEMYAPEYDWGHSRS